MSNEAIKRLAQKCAYSNLRFQDSKALFDALYTADALALENGNVTLAASRAGVCREWIIRKRHRQKESADHAGRNE